MLLSEIYVAFYDMLPHVMSPVLVATPNACHLRVGAGPALAFRFEVKQKYFLLSYSYRFCIVGSFRDRR